MVRPATRDGRNVVAVNRHARRREHVIHPGREPGCSVAEELPIGRAKHA